MFTLWENKESVDTMISSIISKQYHGGELIIVSLDNMDEWFEKLMSFKNVEINKNIEVLDEW